MNDLEHMANFYCLVLFSLTWLSKLIIFIRCEQLVFFKHVFIFIIVFQRINLLPLISAISLIRQVILLNFSFFISLSKNLSFYCFLFQSYILKKNIFIHFLVYLYDHMVISIRKNIMLIIKTTYRLFITCICNYFMSFRSYSTHFISKSFFIL